MNTGMTGWDLVYQFFIAKGMLWLFILLAFIIYILCHPQIVREWNVIITELYAKIQPKVRKKAFTKRISLSIDNAQKLFNKEAPSCFRKLLPYDLKIKWVNKEENVKTIINEKQIVLYVSNYKESSKTNSWCH